MKNIIEVTDIKLYGFHGCLQEEAIIGGHYSIDVYMEVDFRAASEKDDLSKTINYVDIFNIVKEEMAIRSKLIEHVGNRIVTSIKGKHRTIKLLKVTIHKISPPINGDVREVSIQIVEEF